MILSKKLLQFKKKKLLELQFIKLQELHNFNKAS
mgnify:CR=1 FL=1